jgi:hypothetical protein
MLTREEILERLRKVRKSLPRSLRNAGYWGSDNTLAELVDRYGAQLDAILRDADAPQEPTK